MKLLYKSFDRLGPDCQTGYEIYLNQQCNLKIIGYSAYSGEGTTVWYVHPDECFNAQTDWAAPWNDAMLTWQALAGQLNEYAYRKVTVG